MTRYALIDRILANRNRAFSIQDITDNLNEKLPELGLNPVSKRCVEKDIHYLEFGSPFDVEIEEYWVEAGDKNGRPYRKRCIRYSDPAFSIFTPKLSDDERTVLATALETLGSFEGLENFEWLNGLKSRLDIEYRPGLISFSRNILNNSTLLARLFTAIRLRQTLRLSYHTFSNTEKREVVVFPQLLKEYNNRWFLIAAAADTQRLLTFPLDRIDDIDADYCVEWCPSPVDIQERYEEIVGVTWIEERPLQEIVFWISDNSIRYLQTKPIHESQTPLRGEKETALRRNNPLLAGGGFFRIRCRENYELIRELWAYGSELVVVSPENIILAIRKQLARMNELYSC